MKVTIIPSETVELRFGDVCVGDGFTHFDQTYIKTGEAGRALRLCESGPELCWFEAATPVTAIFTITEITITPK